MQDLDAQIASVRRQARTLRRQLGMTVRMSPPSRWDRRRTAMHEAAHCVVALAHGLPVFFVHMGHMMGGRQFTAIGAEGMAVGAVMPDVIGTFAVAGMVQDRSDWLGVSDASALMQYLVRFPQIGAYPNRNAALTRKTIAYCKRQARDILRREKAAVKAVAELISTPGRIHFDGAEIREAALAASSTIPIISEYGSQAAEIWARAMAGDGDAHGDLSEIGLGMIARAAYRERKPKKSRARRPNPKPVACPARRP